MGWAPSGRRVQLLGPQRYEHRSFTCFCLTDLRMPNRGFVLSGIHDGSNTALHFFRFVMWAIRGGHMLPGDVLIVDNASIHTARQILRPLVVIMGLLGMRLIFLPKYSPELNPVELIWAQVKNTLRRDRIDGVPFLRELVRAFGSVDLENVAHYYNHCLYNFR
jgi:transposase